MTTAAALDELFKPVQGVRDLPLELSDLHICRCLSEVVVVLCWCDPAFAALTDAMRALAARTGLDKSGGANGVFCCNNTPESTL